jgi:gamma-glutamylcyclotransferase
LLILTLENSSFIWSLVNNSHSSFTSYKMDSFPSSNASSRSSSPSPSQQYPNSTLYFAYGTDLWHHQLLTRCPNAKYIGIGRLRHWQWQINTKGYANIIEAPMPDTYDASILRWLGPLMANQGGDPREDDWRTYGAVWAISDDEAKKIAELEKVGECYTKEESYVEYWSAANGAGPISVLKRPRRVKVMFHVDRTNTANALAGTCSMEYGYRMNQAIIDALAHGVPQGYINTCIRPFLPKKDAAADEDVLMKGMREAVRLGVDVRKLVEQIEKELAMNGPLANDNGQEGEKVLKMVREMAPQEEQKQLETSRGRALTSGS